MEAEAVNPGRPPKARTGATKFLREALKAGPILTRRLQGAAKEAGVAWGTVRRAADELKVVRTPVGPPGPGRRWQWGLPKC